MNLCDTIQATLLIELENLRQKNCELRQERERLEEEYRKLLKPSRFIDQI